jgi:predicted dehydrogenase
MKMWLVGAGYWGSKLLQSLEKFSIDAQIIDIRNGQTIADINTLDPVMLATPLWQHHQQACELLQRGHDVYVEKPLAQTLDQVRDIETHIKPGQLLMVGHLFVHHPQMSEIKNIINSGRIGHLTHISSSRLNWGIYQTKTDPLLSLATHDITIVQTMANHDPEPIKAISWNYSNNVQPDRVWFSGSCGNISFDIDVSWHWPVRTRQTVVLGTLGQIIWDQDTNTITVTQNHIKERRAVADANPEVISYNHQLSPLEAELGHWVDCLKSRTHPSTGLASAKMVAKTIDAVKKLI